MKNKNVQIPKSIKEQTTRSAPCAMPSTNSHIPWRLFTQRPDPKNSNFRARIILKHIVRFWNNQPYVPWYVKSFLACWILLPVTLFSSSCFIEILTTVTGKRNKEWFKHKQKSCVFQGNSHAFIMLDMKDAVWHVQHESQWKIAAVLCICWKSCVGNLSFMSCYAHA